MSDLDPAPAVIDVGYWETRYLQADTPWNKGEASPALLDFLAKQSQLPRARVAVPGCGLGHDVRAWSAAGFAATGIDLAPSAVQGARAANQPADNAQFAVADFLTETPAAPFDWLFEHTLYCAIQPGLRDAYAAAAARWLAPRGQLLAVHYLLPPDEPDGPPFGCTKEEILNRFADRFELLAEWAPRSWEHRTGLEHCFWWRKK